MSKKKGFNPMDAVFNTAEVGAGTMIGAGMVSKLGDTLPSPMSGAIMKGMEPMAMLPTMSAAGGVFDSLRDLNRKARKK